mmetsp:Transcript_107461/g.302387  ORF Transcript_107461/g.302387 Transcript_107461/m.302387 type:complete len:227 (+) Transcript_107461:1060-1740(+)
MELGLHDFHQRVWRQELIGDEERSVKVTQHIFVDVIHGHASFVNRPHHVLKNLRHGGTRRAEHAGSITGAWGSALERRVEVLDLGVLATAKNQPCVTLIPGLLVRGIATSNDVRRVANTIQFKRHVAHKACVPAKNHRRKLALADRIADEVWLGRYVGVLLQARRGHDCCRGKSLAAIEDEHADDDEQYTENRHNCESFFQIRVGWVETVVGLVDLPEIVRNFVPQ